MVRSQTGQATTSVKGSFRPAVPTFPSVTEYRP